MSRTYEIVQSASGNTWRILSNGKPLRWYYVHRSYAEGVVEQLQQKARNRQHYAEAMKRSGRKPAPRDSKRSAAYRAEHLAGVRSLPTQSDLTPARIAERCVAWAKEAGLTPLVPVVRITRRKKGNGAHCWLNQIVFSPTSVTLGIIAHEYAHALTWDVRPAHDPTWAATYVKLLRVALGADMGPIYASRLEHEFRAAGVL
jgi:hypothetical protein